MKSEQKRLLAEKIRRRFTKLIAPYGFVRSKTSFWVRMQPQTIEFIHLHLFSFQPAFRLHLGIRVLNDPFEAPHLNGPTTDQYREYGTAFSSLPDSLDRCAEELHRFSAKLAEPWFRRWRDLGRLAGADGSPLSAQERRYLEAALRGDVNATSVALSRSLLGAA